MRLPNCFARRLASATLAIVTLSVGLAAPAEAQNPAHVPRIEQGGRAFWGIPMFPPLPVESPPDVTLAYYQGAAGHHHQSPHAACVEGESGLPGTIIEGTRPAPFPYGYFGASDTRHWQRHFGFRQAYTQWTLK